jgi:hypothetical protein
MMSDQQQWVERQIKTLLGSAKRGLTGDTLRFLVAHEDDMELREAIKRMMLDGNIEAVATKTFKDGDPLSVDDFLVQLREER